MNGSSSLDLKKVLKMQASVIKTYEVNSYEEYYTQCNLFSSGGQGRIEGSQSPCESKTVVLLDGAVYGMARRIQVCAPHESIF